MRRSLCIGAALLAASCVSVYAQTIQISKENRTVAVTATDSASAMADLALLHIGFRVYGPDEQGAYAAGSTRSNAVVDALHRAGVPADAIESDSQQLSPLGDYQLKDQPAALKGMRFELSQSWTVRAASDTAAKLLDIAIKAGANQSGSIEWEMKDAGVLESEAASRALAHAQGIAAAMAQGLHTHLGPLLYASNQAEEQRRPVPMARAMTAKAVPDPAPLAISPRRVERSSTVYAVFGLE